MVSEEAPLLHNLVSERLTSKRAQLVVVVVIASLGCGAVIGWTKLRSELCTTSTVDQYAALAVEYPKNESWSALHKCRGNAKVLGFQTAQFGGLVNQLIFLGQALARACHNGDSVILDVRTVNMIDKSLWLPQFKSDLVSATRPRPWSDIVNYDELNHVLASTPGCRQTQVEPQQCARTRHVRCPYDLVNFELDTRLEKFGKALLSRLPLKMKSCVPKDRWPYHAIHLNLDVDWITVSIRGKKNSDYFDYLKMSPAERDEYSRTCCSSTGFYADWAKMVSLDLAAKVAQLPAGPLFIATNIGKPGYTTLAWLLEHFKQHLGGREVLECPPGSVKSERELNALQELATMSAASSLVVHMPSTFSMLACRLAQERGSVCYRGFGEAVERTNAFYVPMLHEVRTLRGHTASL